MSVICLQFGQCGNQVGEKLYSAIYQDIRSNCVNPKSDAYKYTLSSINEWFDVSDAGRLMPRSVLIDTENKVTDKQGDGLFQFRQAVARAYGGSANNWAYGYSARSRLLMGEVLDAIQSEVEKCDYLTNILNIYGSSGGTGSGVGSKIIELLRDTYPSKAIVNAVILPYINGEVVVQSYNSLLTLAKLYQVADSTVLFENDRLHYICNNSLDIKQITFSNINSIIAKQLASVYQPLSDTSLGEYVLLDLTAHPSYKFLHIKSAPHVREENLKYESSCNWNRLVDSLSKQCRYEYQQQTRAGVKLKSKYISNALISYGVEKMTETDYKLLADPRSYVNWLPKNEWIKNYHQFKKFQGIERYLAMISNSNSVYVPLNSIVEDAWNLFTHGAYLHHYEKYGVDKDFFLEHFQIMEDILHDYKTL